MTDPVTDSVTLNQALQFAGTADIGLLFHAITRAAPGLPPFGDTGVDGAAWDAVKADVRQHVQWHVDPAYTEHALPGGKEKITRGPSLDDTCVYEG